VSPADVVVGVLAGPEVTLSDADVEVADVLY